MTSRCFLALVGLAGCGSSSPGPTPAPPPPSSPRPAATDAATATATSDAAAAPAGFPALAQAELVATIDDALVAFAFAPTVHEVGRLPLGDRSYVIDWVDRDHVLVQRGDDHVVIGATEIVPIEEPPDAIYEAIPKPKVSRKDPEFGGTELAPLDGTYVARDGRVVWQRCAWGFASGDGDHCLVDTRTRVWPPDPTHAIEKADRGFPAAPTPWKDAAPAFAVTLKKHKLTCRDGKRTVALATTPDDLVASQHWVSGTPAALIVEYGDRADPFVAAERFAVFTACTETPVVKGQGLELGMDGVWFADGEDDRKLVYRGATSIGALGKTTSLRIRPR